MTDSTLRDQVARQARTDPAAALTLARQIPDPWYRTQALAWVARFSPDQAVLPIAAESLHSAASGHDTYQQLAATAWPLRALIERGHHQTAARELQKILARESSITPPSSRSQALFLMLQAVFALGSEVRSDLALRLHRIQADAGHWRTRRNLLDALAMLTAVGDPAATRIASQLPAKEQARIATDAATAEPRPFFW